MVTCYFATEPTKIQESFLILVGSGTLSKSWTDSIKMLELKNNVIIKKTPRARLKNAGLHNHRIGNCADYSLPDYGCRGKVLRYLSAKKTG